jgi:hypothetical protein
MPASDKDSMQADFVTIATSQSMYLIYRACLAGSALFLYVFAEAETVLQVYSGYRKLNRLQPLFWTFT